MNMLEVIFSSLFCFAMVFALLGVLYVLVNMFTEIIRFVEFRAKK